MSAHTVTWAWRQQLPEGLKYLLVALAENADAMTRMCTLHVDQLARFTCIDETSLRVRLAQLAERNLITTIDTAAGMKNPIVRLMLPEEGA